MPAKQLAIAIVVGIAAIAMGVIPGLLAGIQDGIERFHNSISSLPARRTRRYEIHVRQRVEGQIWFAVAGAALIVINLFVYFSD